MNKYILNLTMVFSTILLLSACGGGDSSTPPTLQSIKIVAQTTQLPIGADIQLQAIARFTDGTQQDITSTANWSSSNLGVITVTSDGKITGVTLGSSDIEISYNGLTDLEVFTVLSAQIKSIIITSPIETGSYRQYDDYQFKAEALYTNNIKIDITDTALWESNNSGVATITQEGLLTTDQLGDVNISVSTASMISKLPITVDIAVTKYEVYNTNEFRSALVLRDLDEENLINLHAATYKVTDSGSGVFGVYSSRKLLRIVGVDSNVILDGDNQGTAVVALYGLVIAKNITIQNGSTGIDTSGDIKIYDSIIKDNHTTKGSCAGIHYSGNLTIYNSEIINNTALSSIYGAGLCANTYDSSSKNLTIHDSNISFNKALEGGAIYSGSSGCKVTMYNTNIIGNETNSSGVIVSYGDTNIHSSYIADNLTHEDRGSSFSKDIVYIAYGDVNITNSIFENNGASLMAGQSSTKNIIISNTLFIDNNISGFRLNARTAQLLNCSFFNNTLDITGASNNVAEIDNSFIDVAKITTVYSATNVIHDSNPGFIDYSNGNYQLSSSSVMINAGTDSTSKVVAPVIDKVNTPRPQGVAVDIGPYEFIE